MKVHIKLTNGRWTFVINVYDSPPLAYYMAAKRWCIDRNRKEGRL